MGEPDCCAVESSSRFVMGVVEEGWLVKRREVCEESGRRKRDRERLYGAWAGRRSRHNEHGSERIEP